jgi:hypothetical protein
MAVNTAAALMFCFIISTTCFDPKDHHQVVLVYLSLVKCLLKWIRFYNHAALVRAHECLYLNVGYIMNKYMLRYARQRSRDSVVGIATEGSEFESR